MKARAPRLDSLTSLRYLAALDVVVTHVNPYFLTSHLQRVALSYGYVGVAFFFTLSGFVLTWSCTWQPAGRFWWNRFSRIWPLQAVMMVITYVFLWDWAFHPPGPVGWLLQPFLLQDWDRNQHVYAAGNGPTWSLSCEFFFYLMFPLVIVIVRRLGGRGVLLSAAGVIAVMVAVPALVGPHVSAATYTWLFFYLPAYRFGEFLIGMLLARAVMLGMRFPRPSVGYVLGWAAFAVWVIGLSRYTLGHHGNPVQRPFATVLALPCFALLLVAGASADLSGRSRLMRAWLPVRLGEWSFALYMVHDSLVTLFTHHGWLMPPRGLAGFGYLMVFVMLCTLAAIVAHYGLEKPAERWLRNRMPGRRPGKDRRERNGLDGRSQDSGGRHVATHRRQEGRPVRTTTANGNLGLPRASIALSAPRRRTGASPGGGGGCGRSPSPR